MLKISKYISFLILSGTLLLFSGFISAETKSPVKTASKGVIKGRIFDEDNNKPVAYATVNLQTMESGKLVTGTISKTDGSFVIENLEPGTYHMTVKFIGFKEKDVTDITVSDDNLNIDLGTVRLNEDAVMTDEIVVEADKKAVEYLIDRKIVNVDKSLASSSGTAVDVLKNVPSIQTDLLGNVTLRGSGGFIVMIDGRTSILDPNDALTQIPSATIDKIEIITNPSSKFDPDGTAGIINIILKKESREGHSGLFSFNLGRYDRIGGDALVNYKNTKYHVFLGLDYNQSDTPGNVEENSYTTNGDVITNISNTGVRYWGGNRYGIRGGVEYDFTDFDRLSLQGRYGGRYMNARSNLNYTETFSNSIGPNSYLSEQNWKRDSKYFSVILDYFKTFDDPKHKMLVQLDYSSHSGTENSKNEMLDSNDAMFFGSISTEDGPSYRFTPKIDYSLPLSETDMFEAGLQSRFGFSKDITTLYDYDFDNSEYVLNPDFSNEIDYYRDIHAVYSQYSGKYEGLGYQVGLRGEYTYRNIEAKGDSNTFFIDRWDYFPTAYLSYKFNDELEGTVNYTRRIDRPRGWYLEPFITKIDVFNLRRGNPELLPEYIDSYELGLLKYFGSNTISLEGFYKRITNKTERVKYLIDPDNNIFMNTIENVGTDYSLGAEMMFDFNVFTIVDFTLSGSGYQYIIDSEINGKKVERNSFNWNSKFKTNIKFTKTTNFEFTLNYYSETVSAQGRKEGFYTAGAAIRQELFDNRLSLILQADDLFNTAKDEYLQAGDSYAIYNYYKITGPVVSFTVRYNFNNYKSQQQRNGGDAGGGEVF